MKPSASLAMLCLISACTTIEINEQNAFDNHRTVTPESFENETLTLRKRTIVTEDCVSLNSWFLLRDDAEATVYYFGGNDFLMVKSQPLIEVYANIPVNLIMPDYRSYGLSSGEPNVVGIQTDARTMFDEALELVNDHSTPFSFTATPWDRFYPAT